jgi:tellurite resistance protein
MDLFSDVELDAGQAAAMARAMLAVARADGAADPREVSLIEELSPVDASAPDPAPADVAAALPGEKERDLLVRSLLLVALVDGEYTDAEKRSVASYAAACGVSEARLEELASAVKAYLMGPLLPLSNSPAVAEVSRKLKV